MEWSGSFSCSIGVPDRRNSARRSRISKLLSGVLSPPRSSNSSDLLFVDLTFRLGEVQRVPLAPRAAHGNRRRVSQSSFLLPVPSEFPYAGSWNSRLVLAGGNVVAGD